MAKTKPGDDTPKKHPNLGAAWEPGQSGNPKGRAKGARTKLSEAFWADLYEVWKVKGSQAIDDMIQDKPGDFVRVVATQMPRELMVTHNPLGDMTDTEIEDAIAFIRASLSPDAKRAADREADKTRH